MKLGDSLGRRRRRRKTPEEKVPDSEEGAEEGAEWPYDMDRTATVDGAPKKRGLGISVQNLAIGIVGLAFFGWLFGYVLATRVVFPAPPPPGDLFEVPDLTGLGVASAEERLQGTGLELGSVDSLQHPTVGSGLILGQSPLPGQLARGQTPVQVTLSTGPQTRSVPDVMRLDGSRARTVLETSGFIVEMDSVEADELRGRVVEVSPSPDSVVALPAEVRVTVSTGPPVVTMPLLLGMDQAEAEMVLDSLGLSVSDVEEVFRFGRDQGVVVEQEPAADEELRRGSSVSLKVGRRGLEGEQ
jgi:beta-lactam-binding protein with PASTA domain